jgi:hypothetical protein
MSGWIPVFDTMHGIRGEVNIIVKVELFSDFNKFRQSSCGVQLFYCEYNVSRSKIVFRSLQTKDNVKSRRCSIIIDCVVTVRLYLQDSMFCCTLQIMVYSHRIMKNIWLHVSKLTESN